MQEAIIEFAEYDEPGAEGGAASREAPALLTTLRWSSQTHPDAVLLSPADVRRAWLDFRQARSPRHTFCAVQDGPMASWQATARAIA